MSDVPPYRSGMATGIGVVLSAGLAVAIGDLVHAGGGGLALLGLWALLALPVAIGTGLVLGAGNATWGAGWVRGVFRRLRDDDDLDRNIAALLVAAAVIAGVLALAISKLAVGLVGDVQRKSVGALLLGVTVVALLPVLALGALPLFRITRQITALVPRLGPLSRVIVLVVVAAGLTVLAGGYIVTRKLDYQALNLGSIVAPALVPVLALAIALVTYGPASALRERVPRRGWLAAAALVVAIALPALGLRGQPSPATQLAVTERSYIGGRMIGILRKLSDHDHDGYSAFFGGPDCNDHDASIHPGAKDIPDDGIDQNCDGFDTHATGEVSPSDQPKTTLKGGDNVIVIFVDTLRFDRVNTKLAPHLDAFAQQAVVFRHAYAQAPNTPRSVPSFLTSQYPSQLKVDKQFKDYSRLDDDNDTLFEALRTKLHTVGETSHFFFCDDTCAKEVVNTDGRPMRSNITQGADEWDNTGALPIPESNHDSAGPRIVAKTVAKLDALAKSKQKFAMIVHLFEPHSTYMEHEGFAYKTHSFEEKYDGEIAYVDGQIGQLLDAIDRTGLAANTTVVVMSDHGEAFAPWHGSEAGFYHGMSLYQELLHVPLMFRVPGAKPAARDDVVQLVDLAPTIAALFDVPAPSTWQGRSLVPAIDGKDLPARPAFAEMLPAPEWNHEAKAMIAADARREVIHQISENRYEIFDLDADPDEKKNLGDGDPHAKELEQALSDWVSKL